MCYGLGDYKSPGLIGRTFLRRISNPSGRLIGVWDGWRGWNFQGTKKVVES